MEEGDGRAPQVRGGGAGQEAADGIVVGDLAARDHLGQEQAGERLGERTDLEAGVGVGGRPAAPRGLAGGEEGALGAAPDGERHGARAGCGVAQRPEQ
ncbi:hypothetical protein JQK87_21330, partial [Streptomyces sp. G44]|nr:hypothetical protein [Streptomyces sp. G44]